MNEFFLTLVRLRLGLFQFDCFGISQSTVSRIRNFDLDKSTVFTAKILIWPPKSLIVSNMSKAFKYTCTRVIIDATEILVEQPLPEQQQLTFYTTPTME